MSVGAPDYPTPTTVAQAIAATHASAEATRDAVTRLLGLFEARDENPELHTVVINNGNNGLYTVTQRVPWVAKSIAVLNPTNVVVYVGIGGVSPTAAARAVSVPPMSALTLPVREKNLEFGCDPAALGANAAVFYLFRYKTVQPLSLSQVP